MSDLQKCIYKQNEEIFYNQFIHNIVSNMETNEVVSKEDLQKIKIKNIHYIDEEYALMYLEDGKGLNLEVI